MCVCVCVCVCQHFLNKCLPVPIKQVVLGKIDANPNMREIAKKLMSISLNIPNYTKITDLMNKVNICFVNSRLCQ